MKNKLTLLFTLSLALFIIAEVILVKAKAFEIGILLYLLYCGTLFMINKKLVVAFFVFQLPLSPLIPTDFKLMGLLGPFEIVNGIALVTMLILSSRYKSKLNKMQKLAIKFVWFLFFINAYVTAKKVFMGHSEETELSYVLKNVFRYFIYHFSLILLIKIIYKEQIFKFITIGVKTSLVVLVISMFFNKFLIMNDIGTLYENKTSLLRSSYTRVLGLYSAGGDVNSAGIFLAGIFGFLISLFEKDQNIKKYILFFGIAVLGVLLTGSRTGFMGLSVVILIFLITNKSGGAKIALLLTCVIFFFAFNEQLTLVFDRFMDKSTQKAVNPEDKEGRAGKWVIYTEWIMDHPETFVFGNQEEIYLKRSPHNYFIYIAYHAGIIPLLIFLQLIVKLIKSIKFKTTLGRLKNAYYIIPFFLILMTVNSFGSSIYLWLYLPFGFYYYPELIKQDK